VSLTLVSMLVSSCYWDELSFMLSGVSRGTSDADRENDIDSLQRSAYVNTAYAQGTVRCFGLAFRPDLITLVSLGAPEDGDGISPPDAPLDNPSPSSGARGKQGWHCHFWNTWT